MERNRSTNAKSLRAAGRQPVKNEIQEALHHRASFGKELIPVRNFAQTVRMTRRFNQISAVTNQAFTLAQGHDQFLVVTSTLGNAASYVDSWRIRKIKIWAISEANFPTSVTVTPTGSDIDSNMMNDPESIWQITSRSQANPASMVIVPSETKPLGSWHFTNGVNNAGTLFQMNILLNGGASQFRTTMDIEFDVKLNQVGLPLGYGVTTGTTVPGTLGGRNILSGFNLVGVNNLG